jgi:hypothetical protein
MTDEDDKKQKPIWLITGCSTGFGRELTELLIEQGFRVIATARGVGYPKYGRIPVDGWQFTYSKGGFSPSST